MKRADAVLIAEDLQSELAPLCEKIEIAGSIRRHRPSVNDIDLVCLPKFMQLDALRAALFGLAEAQHSTLTGGERYLKILRYRGIQVDVYIADSTTWAALLLIRTGSREHNILLCRRARDLGYILHADGRGLGRIATAEPVHCATERAIFERLGLPYREPEEREA